MSLAFNIPDHPSLAIISVVNVPYGIIKLLYPAVLQGWVWLPIVIAMHQSSSSGQGTRWRNNKDAFRAKWVFTGRDDRRCLLQSPGLCLIILVYLYYVVQCTSKRVHNTKMSIMLSRRLFSFLRTIPWLSVIYSCRGKALPLPPLRPGAVNLTVVVSTVSAVQVAGEEEEAAAAKAVTKVI